MLFIYLHIAPAIIVCLSFTLSFFFFSILFLFSFFTFFDSFFFSSFEVTTNSKKEADRTSDIGIINFALYWWLVFVVIRSQSIGKVDIENRDFDYDTIFEQKMYVKVFCSICLSSGLCYNCVLRLHYNYFIKPSAFFLSYNKKVSIKLYISTTNNFVSKGDSYYFLFLGKINIFSFSFFFMLVILLLPSYCTI